jgi:hypothetical protein
MTPTSTSSLKREFQAHFRRAVNDPDYFNSRFLRRRPYWSKQKEMCAAVVRYRAVAIESGNAVGKGYWVAGIILWWLYTRLDARVIATGPSQTVLNTVTWEEVRRALDHAPLLRGMKVSKGIKTSPQTVIFGTSRALGYSTTNVERASGQHARHLLAVVEEASGVETPAWEAIAGLRPSKIVAIGNPLRADGGFADMVRDAEQDRLKGIPDHDATFVMNIPSTESPHAHLRESPFGMADRTWLDSVAR